MENKKLETYLADLEKALGPISVPKKADIITEIKSHVLEALSKSNQSTSDILSRLGKPEQVANKYLLERGFELQRPRRHSIVKWLVIGFLGTFSILLLSTFVLIWKFTPLIKVDAEKGRVQLMGGLIDIHERDGIIGELIGIYERDGTLKIGDIVNSGNYFFNSQFYGKKEITDKIKEISLDFSNVDLEIKNGEENIVEYDCELNGKVHLSEANKALIFNFKNSANANCEFYIPKKIELKINSQNGEFSFYEINNNLDFNGMNGEVKFRPNHLSKYKYDLSVMNGKIDGFQSSEDLNAYKINISLMNGKIKN